MASDAAAEQELDRERYLQELIRGSMLDPPKTSPSTSSSSSSRGGRVPPLTDDEIGRFYCEICKERKLSFDRFRASDVCAHEFCIACVVGHIEARVSEGKVPVPCPAADCLDGGVMHPEACKKLLDIDVFDAWCVALCELAVGSARARCPYSGCGEMMVLDADDHAPPATVSKVSCPTCSRAFCVQCEEAWDDRHGSGGDGSAGCALTQLAETRDWSRCPSCRAMIDKIDGCNDMVCRCGSVFCYGCGSHPCSCASSGHEVDDDIMDSGSQSQLWPGAREILASWEE